MTDRRSDTEKQIHLLIQDALHLLETHHLGRHAYQELAGHLRDVRVLLDNKEYGCWSGAHAHFCTCTINDKGHSLSHPERYKNQQNSH